MRPERYSWPLKQPCLRPYSQDMVWRVLQKLVVVFAVFAFLGGTTVQAMPLASGPVAGVAATLGLPCGPMPAVQANQAAPPHAPPCKGITPDCLKQMGCVGIASLPARPNLAVTAVSYAITYWPAQSGQGGLSPEPDVLPPITA